MLPCRTQWPRPSICIMYGCGTVCETTLFARCCLVTPRQKSLPKSAVEPEGGFGDGAPPGAVRPMGLSERFLALGICPWRVVHAGIRSYDPRGPDKAHATLSPHGLNRSRESSGVEIAPRSPTPRDARRGWVVRGWLCAQWRHRSCPISTESIALVGFLKLLKCSRQTSDLHAEVCAS